MGYFILVDLHLFCAVLCFVLSYRITVRRISPDMLAILYYKHIRIHHVRFYVRLLSLSGHDRILLVLFHLFSLSISSMTI